MTAEEFFNTQTITDAQKSVIDIHKSKFTYWDLIKFADYYGKDQYNQALDDAIDLLNGNGNNVSICKQIDSLKI